MLRLVMLAAMLHLPLAIVSANAAGKLLHGVPLPWSWYCSS
jgi:hypothetical protein